MTVRSAVIILCMLILECFLVVVLVGDNESLLCGVDECSAIAVCSIGLENELLRSLKWCERIYHIPVRNDAIANFYVINISPELIVLLEIGTAQKCCWEFRI